MSGLSFSKRMLIYGLPIPLIILSLFMGSFTQLNTLDFLSTLWLKLGGKMVSESRNDLYEMSLNIILNVRLPRILLTFLVGSSLSLSGSVLQSLFRNPLVDSYILGISSGAALGASLSILFSLGVINLYAFVGGVLAVIITYLIANGDSKNSTVSIVLSGMIVSGIFLALLTLVQYIANPYKLQAIVQWTMGNLNAASWMEIKQIYLPVLLCLAGIYLFRWRLNILSMGDEACKAVGVNPLPEKVFFIAASTLLTSATVAVAGIISFYGLFIPHIVRMLTGADNSRSVPANIFLGGSFLLLIDTLSRTLFLFEVPIGIFTTLLGGGFFVYLMKRDKISWN